MYYLQLDEADNNKLNYYCRNCGNKDEKLVANLNNIYVSKTDIKREMNYKNSINKYTKLDPTLPRIHNIDCPNQECNSNIKETTEETKEGNKEEKEILYIRYDDANMKFVYLCGVCDTVWNTESK
jgi:DNA-directed RNA polymerase subunit M/transcription elongation factor TFIIS